MPKLHLVPVIAACALLVACTGASWKRTLEADTASAYHRFLREHPHGKRADEARERLAFVRVRTNPSLEGFDEFRAEYPDSVLAAELAPVVEEKAFGDARAAGTLAAYRGFLERFPDGRHRARADGNLAFLTANGYAGQLAELAAFAESHPESDFAAEARRTAAAAGTRSAAFRKVGLLIEIEAGTPGADRLARVFTQRARDRYRAAGVPLVAVRSGGSTEGLSAIVAIRHSERAVQSELGAEKLTRSGILASTTVSLTAAAESEPFWSDTFTYRSSAAARSPEKSILFTAGTGAFWSGFFVPLATWNSRVAVRPPQLLEKPPAALETSGSRAIVLYGDGDFQVFDLGDPAQPLLVGAYRRERDLAKFGGVRLLGNRVAVFGEDGLEVAEFAGGETRRVVALDRSAVGSLVGVERLGSSLVLASNRGLLLLPEGGSPRRLVERNILGLARAGDRILFTDGVSLFVSTLPLLQQQRVEAELKLGRGFGPQRVRVSGRTAVVVGERGITRVDLSNPARPRVGSYIMMSEVGTVRDAVLSGGRLFLLGARGLQLADPTGERVVDSADVDARARLSAMGRHLVMIGGSALQVVDTTPFLARGVAKAR